MVLVLWGAAVDDRDGWVSERESLLADIELFNAEVVRLGVPVLVPSAVAARFETADLPGLVAKVRRHYLQTLHDMDGLG